MRVAVIGGGAAGCFAAVNIMTMCPDADVTVFEAGQKPLAKVAITGGGRCNLTNTFRDIANMDEAYPRGHRLMKRLFHKFDQKDTCRWFEERGVRLVVQDDQCVFPESQDSMEIVECLDSAMRAAGVKLRTGCRVTGIEPGWKVQVNGSESWELFDAVIVTIGGKSGQNWSSMFAELDLELENPVPSLFSVRTDDAGLKALMGTVVDDVTVSIPRTRFKACGPLLVTDWGMSGPAVLKLSSYAARFLAECSYQTSMVVNWFGSAAVQKIAGKLASIAKDSPKKLTVNAFPEIFNSRLWEYFLCKSGISPESRWQDIGAKGVNRLAERLHADEYRVTGKNRFRTEFVTCGGIALSNLNPATLECKKYPGLYFAGEITDVDAITGGFNLQAAWTMGYVTALSVTGNIR